MRLIDADALKDRFENLAYDDWNQGAETTLANAFREAADVVDDAPTIDTEPGWIPVTERPPEPNEIEENGCRRYYLTQDEYGDMMVCSWNGFKWEQIYQLEPTDYEIVAWMPLPEPWKGGR